MALENEKESSEGTLGLDGEDSKGDDVCAICDNGGNVVCCDGVCQRSFHLDESENTRCWTKLKLNLKEAKRIRDMKEGFICNNCRYKQHQCFSCGELGSSDKTSLEAEVFQCGRDDCARFYHAKCIAELLYPGTVIEAGLFEGEVAVGGTFSCPMHECVECRGKENKENRDTQFALCRRCPTAYHRKCLPSEILFEETEGSNGAQRAWDDILPDRILIYCMKHEIIRKQGTPKRDHIKVPDAQEPYAPPETNEEEVPDHPTSPERAQSPPPAPSDQNQCSCSSPFDSFAPKSLFLHPHPGTCGWLDD